jgi:hypothetical protein
MRMIITALAALALLGFAAPTSAREQHEGFQQGGHGHSERGERGERREQAEPRGERRGGARHYRRDSRGFFFCNGALWLVPGPDCLEDFDD